LPRQKKIYPQLNCGNNPILFPINNLSEQKREEVSIMATKKKAKKKVAKRKPAKKKVAKKVAKRKPAKKAKKRKAAKKRK